MGVCLFASMDASMCARMYLCLYVCIRPDRIMIVCSFTSWCKALIPKVRYESIYTWDKHKITLLTLRLLGIFLIDYIGTVCVPCLGPLM